LTGTPEISIVIPAKNSARTIKVAVAGALEQLGVGDVEVIVVDDGSSDDTAKLAADAGARVIQQDPSGPAAARNNGWRAAKAPIIAFTDSDCKPNQQWCARIIEALKDDKVGAVGGSYDNGNPKSKLARVIHAEIKARHARMRRRVRALGTYNFATRREVLEELDGFDESYTNASGEDNDLSYRMLQAGYELHFIHENTVAHRHPSDLWRYLKSQARHGYWRVKLYRDHPSMTGGDDYSTVADYIAPLLGLAALALVVPALLLVPIVAIAGSIVGAFIILGLDTATVLAYLGACFCGIEYAGQIRDTGQTNEAVAFFFLNGLRAAARGLGLLAGLLQFGVPARKGIK